MKKTMFYCLLGMCLLARWCDAECPDGFEQIRPNKCQDINECSASTERTCDQLCANEPGAFRCGCLDGYLLGSDNTSCLVDSPDTVIYFRRRKDIARVDPAGLHPEAAARRIGSIRSFDVHQETGKIYWIDGRGPSIGMTPIGEKGQIEVFDLENLMKPETLKIDWMNEMLYWTDSKSKMISRCSLNGTDQQTVLVSQKRPKALVLDPFETFIFWSTSGKYGRIYRADFDGRTRDALVKTDLGVAFSLDVDIIDKRLYWLDMARGVIESVNYQGTDRMLLVEGIGTGETGLSLLADSIYWLESDPPAIHRADRRTGRRQVRIRSDYFLPGQSGLIVMHPNKQPGTQEFYNGDCTTWNNCHQFPHDHKVPRNSPFVLFTTNDTIRKIDQDGSNYAYVLPNENFRNLVGVDYDVRGKKVYFADSGRNVIESAYLDGSDRRVVVDQSELGTVEAIALDWSHRKLYWTDSSLRRVTMMSLFRHSSRIIAEEDVDEPRGITVHATLNWVYWTDISAGAAKIYACQHDGSYRRAVISSGLYFPNDITIDLARNMLVWVDYGLQVIEQSTLEGLERQVIYRIAESGHENLQPHSVAVMGNFLWYTNWEDDTVVRVDTRDNDLLDIVGEDIWRPTGIKAVDPKKNWKRLALDPCTVFNGLCEQICEKSAVNQVVCSCDPGFRGHENGRSCLVVDPCVTGHHTCAANAICRPDNDGGYDCICPLGLEYNTTIGCIGKEKPCLSGRRTCAENSICHPDDAGGYSCLCPRGMEYNMTIGCTEMKLGLIGPGTVPLPNPSVQNEHTTATSTVGTTSSPTEALAAITDDPDDDTITQRVHGMTSGQLETTLGYVEGEGRCPESHKNFCHNGGKCVLLVELNSPACRCQPRFRGERCMYANLDNWDLFFSNPMAVAVSGGVILPLCFIIILLGICFVCRRATRTKGSPSEPDRGLGTDVFYRRSSSYHQREGAVTPVFCPSQDNIQMETVDRTSFGTDQEAPNEQQFSTFPRRAPSSSKNNNNSAADDIAMGTPSSDQTYDASSDLQVPGGYEDMSQGPCSSYTTMSAPAGPKDHGYMSTIERHYTVL